MSCELLTLGREREQVACTAMAGRLVLALARGLAFFAAASAQALTLTGTAYAAGYLTGCTVRAGCLALRLHVP